LKLTKLENNLREILTYSEELGLDIHSPRDRFLWFIASMLFAKRSSVEY